jgi:hypothetical protein
MPFLFILLLRQVGHLICSVIFIPLFYQNLIQRNGVSDAHSGLYFLGFPKQRNFASATLRGVGADAAYIMPLLLKDLKN